jgi:hypothetical protein
VIQKWFANDECSSVIITADELSILGKVAQTNGSTLVGELCRAWIGADLNNDVKSASIPHVPGGTYRIGMVSGIQPGNARMLLGRDASQTGLTQRVIWFDSRKDLPEVLPEHPGLLSRPPALRYEPVVRYCQAAYHDLDRWQRQPEHDPLDKHLMFNRCKVAYALAVLNSRTDLVNEQDWELAGIVMEHSGATRRWVQREISALAQSEAEDQGKRQGIRDAAAAETIADRLHVRAEAHLAKHGEKSRRDCMKSAKGDIRELVGELWDSSHGK